MHPIAWLFVLAAAVGVSFLVVMLLRRQRHAASLSAISMLQATGSPLGHHAQLQLAGQVTHARRYERPLSALVLGPDEDGLLDDADLERSAFRLPDTDRPGSRDLLPLRSARHSAALRIANLLREATRESDIVTYDTQHCHFVILLPETTKPQAMQAMQRLYDLIYQRTYVPLRGGVAQFPDDGVTLEALLNSAQADYKLQKEAS